MTTTLRRIAPLGERTLRGLVPGGADMPAPKFAVVDPRHLFVDETYQRELGEKSITMIRGIVRNWDWANYKCPVVVKTEAGLHVIDGQHTAIAAATHPKIGKITVMVVEANTPALRARAFIGQNTNRLAVTGIQVFRASVQARDPDAVMVKRICDSANVTVKINPHTSHAGKDRATMAVKAIQAMAIRRGAKLARDILCAVADAGIAPIGMVHLLAAEHLIAGKEFAEPRLSLQGLVEMLQAVSVFDCEIAARKLAKEIKIPANKALAMIWHRQFVADRQFVVAIRPDIVAAA